MNEDNNKKIRQMKGWFYEEDIQLFDFINQHLIDEGVKGNIAEIGVYYGKSFAKLASYINIDWDEKLLGIDNYIRDTQQNDEIMRNVQMVSDCTKDNVTIILAHSYNVNESNINSDFYHNCKFVHLDGSHAGVDVYNDMALADKLVNKDGILILDDWHNKSYPHLQEAVYKYIALHPDSFEKFLVSNNKCYLCRPHMISNWLWYTETNIVSYFNKTEYGKNVLATNSILKTEHYLTNSNICLMKHNDELVKNDYAYKPIHTH